MMFYVGLMFNALQYFVSIFCIFRAARARDKLSQIAWLMWSILIILTIISDQIVEALK